jgi:hypothetical protein
MTAQAASILTVLATEGAEPGGEAKMNSLLNAVLTFAVLVVLLFITTRLNKDR